VDTQLNKTRMNKYQKEQKKRRWILTVYGSKFFSFPKTFKLRVRAYQKHFNIGKNPIIEHGVWLQRTHGLEGSILMGDNVLLARNCEIDYSGGVTIRNNVAISEGAIIISHSHDLTDPRSKNIIPSSLIIEENVWIGTYAQIMAGVNRIGKNAIVSPGSVVYKDVPDFAIVRGNPAKIITILPSF